MLVVGIILVVVGAAIGYAVPHYGPAYGNWGYGPGAILVAIGLILVIIAVLAMLGVAV